MKKSRARRPLALVLALMMSLAMAIPAFANVPGSGGITRAEGLAMIIHMLGSGDEAGQGDFTNPFTDVHGRDGNYAAYAFNRGLIFGTSPTTFDPDATMTSAEFITILLRVLGWGSDDFYWRTPWALSDALNITTGQFTATQNVYIDLAGAESLLAGVESYLAMTLVQNVTIVLLGNDVPVEVLANDTITRWEFRYTFQGPDAPAPVNMFAYGYFDADGIMQIIYPTAGFALSVLPHIRAEVTADGWSPIGAEEVVGYYAMTLVQNVTMVLLEIDVPVEVLANDTITRWEFRYEFQGPGAPAPAHVFAYGYFDADGTMQIVYPTEGFAITVTPIIDGLVTADGWSAR